LLFVVCFVCCFGCFSIFGPVVCLFIVSVCFCYCFCVFVCLLFSSVLCLHFVLVFCFVVFFDCFLLWLFLSCYCYSQVAYVGHLSLTRTFLQRAGSRGFCGCESGDKNTKEAKQESDKR